MYTIEELRDIARLSEFELDLSMVRQGLVETRIGQRVLFNDDAVPRLQRFVEAVLASVSSWRDIDQELCEKAGEIAELISANATLDSQCQKRMRLRAALLYELADLPAIASAVLEDGDVLGPASFLMEHRGPFRALAPSSSDLSKSTDVNPDERFTDLLMSPDAICLADYVQGIGDIPEDWLCGSLANIAKELSIGLTATELLAYQSVLEKRASLSTRKNLNSILFDRLRDIQFPPELWANQLQAIQGGLLDPQYDSWGFAAPTGTGKTFLTRMLILETLRFAPDRKVLYIVPSKALVHEVVASLDGVFQPIGYRAVAVTPQLVDLDGGERSELEDASIVVLTPEKADLLLRLGTDLFEHLSLVIVDEAHHLENGSRGILLELYIWRIQRMIKSNVRLVFLSAVTPNMMELVGWIGRNPKAVTANQRTTRMRAGVYRVKGSGKKTHGIIEYMDGTSVDIVSSNVEHGKRDAVVQLAYHLSAAGPVLIVTKGKKECENLAENMRKWLTAHGLLRNTSLEERESEQYTRLDSRLEREMYPSVSMRKVLHNRIAYHHAGLPPRVRVSVEDAVRAGQIDFLFATTTLGEGVNFPFSTVIVQSLALRNAPARGRPASYSPVTPRSFWNIAGRAGRPGFDKEGQVILFEPSLGLDKISYVLEDYLNPSITGVGPVKSALAVGLSSIVDGLASGELSESSLSEVAISTELPREIIGTLNHVRCGLVHARASGLICSSDEILAGTFAEKMLDCGEGISAKRIISLQDAVVREFLESPNAPPKELIAELGLSIETLVELRNYVMALSDNGILSLHRLFFGGKLNVRSSEHTVSAVAQRMAELEGGKLGGFLGGIISQWLSGKPFSLIAYKVSDGRQTRFNRLEDLIQVVYSRIQYLLPWGLYATDRLIESEARRRGLSYGNELRSLAYLADAGVPSLDALRLVGLDFERVDASRLAERYIASGRGRTSDIIAWLLTEPAENLQQCIRGDDNRRLDYDFDKLINSIRTA